MRRLTTYGVIIAAGLLAVGCSAGASSSSGSGSGSGSSSTKTSTNSTLTISNENGAQWTCGFSPLNTSDTLLSVGFVYEPLVYVNPLQNGKTTPMLATSWTWGPGNKTLTFTIRPKPCRRMAGSTACVIASGPATLSSRIRLNWATSTWSSGPCRLAPALFTSPSIR